jgi:hypothetical protein
MISPSITFRLARDKSVVGKSRDDFARTFGNRVTFESGVTCRKCVNLFQASCAGNVMPQIAQ